MNILFVILITFKFNHIIYIVTLTLQPKVRIMTTHLTNLCYYLHILYISYACTCVYIYRTSDIHIVFTLPWPINIYMYI